MSIDNISLSDRILGVFDNLNFALLLTYAGVLIGYVFWRLFQL